MIDPQMTISVAVLLGILTLLVKTSFRTSKEVDSALEQRVGGVENRLLQLEVGFATTHTKHDVAIINLEEKFTSCLEALEKVTDRLDRYMDMRNGNK